jgi:hypothetical protein
VKVLIEDKGTGKFLKDFGDWTTDLRQARNFSQTSLAIEHCVQEKMTTVCVLLVFGMDRRMDVRVEPFSTENRSGTIEGRSQFSE